MTLEKLRGMLKSYRPNQKRQKKKLWKIDLVFWRDCRIWENICQVYWTIGSLCGVDMDVSWLYVHVVHPYSSIDVTAAWKKLLFILSVRSDFHIVDSLLIAVHAFVNLVSMSFSVDSTLLPRYVNLSTSLRMHYMDANITKRLEKKLDGNYTRMLRAILNKSWQQHPTRHQLYGHLPPITKTIQVRRTRHAGHCWRSRDELIRDVLLWIPTHGRAKAGRPARTYIQQLCEDTGCCPEDLPRAMNDREEWRERVRDIRAASTIWWWWWWLYVWAINFSASLHISLWISNLESSICVLCVEWKCCSLHFCIGAECRINGTLKDILIYIYIYRERERGREGEKRERERERERGKEHCLSLFIFIMSIKLSPKQ